MKVPSVLFILPNAGGGGGSNSVVQESMGLRRIGIDVAIAVDKKNAEKFRANYPEATAAGVAVETYRSTGALAQLVRSREIAVATTNGSVGDLRDALQIDAPGQPPRTAYYVQDYEPLFFSPGTEKWERAFRSYTLIPGCVLFAKTAWVQDIVYRNHGVRVAKVEASIDHDIFYPDFTRVRTGTSVLAMLRPRTSRRAPRRTVRVLRALAEKYGASLSLAVFGSRDEILEDYGIELPPGVVNHGSLQRRSVPDLFRKADLFLDLSDFQAFGRSALEGMACGCTPVVPLFGGASEYAVHGHNAFMVDTRSDDDILTAVDRFVNLPGVARATLVQNGIETASRYSILRASLSMLRLFAAMTGDGR